MYYIIDLSSELLGLMKYKKVTTAASLRHIYQNKKKQIYGRETIILNGI